MADRPRLELVLKREPDAAEKVRERIKRMPKPDGTLSCPRCGGRAAARIESGIVIRNGKRQRGTVIEKDICAECWRRNIISDMRTGDEKPERVR